MRNNRLAAVMVDEARSFFCTTDGKFGPQYRVFFDSDYQRAMVFNRNSGKRIAEFELSGGEWSEVPTSGLFYEPADFGGCGSVWNMKDMLLEKTVY